MKVVFLFPDLSLSEILLKILSKYELQAFSRIFFVLAKFSLFKDLPFYFLNVKTFLKYMFNLLFSELKVDKILSLQERDLLTREYRKKEF